MMLGCIVAFVVSVQPLVSTGSKDGVWFVGDRDPAQMQFDASAKGLEYSICARTSTTTYASLQSFLRRPAALALYNNELWFADQRDSIVLYTMRAQPTGELHAMFESTYKTPLAVKGMHQWGEVLALSLVGPVLQVVTYDGFNWAELQLLAEKDACAIVYESQLVAFTPTAQGANAWEYDESGWQSTGTQEFSGTLVDVLIKDEWLLFVTEQSEGGEIWGIQQDVCIQMASFAIPKGRWSVTPSPEGLSLVSVERNGTTQVTDIGWPSGRLSKPIELALAPLHETSFLQQVALFLPMFLFVGFAFLLLRTGNAKSAQ